MQLFTDYKKTMSALDETLHARIAQRSDPFGPSDLRDEELLSVPSPYHPSPRQAHRADPFGPCDLRDQELLSGPPRPSPSGCCDLSSPAGDSSTLPMSPGGRRVRLGGLMAQALAAGDSRRQLTRRVNRSPEARLGSRTVSSASLAAMDAHLHHEPEMWKV
jgi:hypothetical protein